MSKGFAVRVTEKIEDFISALFLPLVFPGKFH